MQIALEKKKKNIAEYLLYMWQLEDLFRAQQLDEASLYNLLVSPLDLEASKKAEIWNWYKVKHKKGEQKWQTKNQTSWSSGEMTLG